MKSGSIETAIYDLRGRERPKPLEESPERPMEAREEAKEEHKGPSEEQKLSTGYETVLGENKTSVIG
jgi:hypothetical protein